MKHLIFVALSTLIAASALAKLPAPVLSDEAKAKAAEAAAKTAHNGKLDGYKLCLSMEKTSAHFFKTTQAAGKTAKPATATPPCADPGAFVFPLPAAATTTAVVTPATPAAVPTAAAATTAVAAKKP